MTTTELVLKGYRLTTAEILYHRPDHPMLLQSYIWQEYDLMPGLPVLNGFLRFWQRELEGRLHSVWIAGSDLLTPAELRYAAGQFSLN